MKNKTVKPREEGVNFIDKINEIPDFNLSKEVGLTKRKILLHSCCGPCSTACIERLIEDYQVTVFFYNPNITDDEEYLKRKEAQLYFIERYNKTVPVDNQVGFIEGEYDPEDFFKVAKGLEEEKEGGLRCIECFKLRMGRTALEAKENGFHIFTTTLTVSPHKNYPIISAIGAELGRIYGVEFLDIDFKKKAGFQRSIELSKKYELYRQNYCGCVYSNWNLNQNKED